MIQTLSCGECKESEFAVKVTGTAEQTRKVRDALLRAVLEAKEQGEKPTDGRTRRKPCGCGS